MKYETVFIMVRVMVHSDHDRISDTVRELESQSSLMLTDTANINILETEILVSRIPNAKVHRFTKSNQMAVAANSGL